MPLIRCTLTGADDATSFDALWSLWREYPFLEIGVLYSSTQQGCGRFPSFDWIDRLPEQLDADPGPDFALHICGRAVGEFLAGTNKHLRALTGNARYFKRIQLNLRADHYDPETIKSGIKRQRWHTVITQHNLANASLLAPLAGLQNHALLFDESGGRGVRCTHWSAPLPGVLCGYAGGLGPDNLAEELLLIDQAAGVTPYWIDMEGSLRDTSDRFVIDRCRRCLEVARQFLT